jgi:hypothetical protein
LNLHLRIQNLSVVVDNGLSDQKNFQNQALQVLERLHLESNREKGRPGTNGTIQELKTPSSHSISNSKGEISHFSSVQIRMSREANSCGDWCSCSCHTRRQLRTPHFMDHVIGSLLVGYSGISVTKSNCNEFACKQRSYPSVHFTYFFPYWFLSRIITMSIRATASQGPELCLKVPRVRGRTEAVFRAAVSGDVEHMKSLLIKGFASPLDVSSSSGLSALHASILL